MVENNPSRIQKMIDANKSPIDNGGRLNALIFSANKPVVPEVRTPSAIQPSQTTHNWWTQLLNRIAGK